MGRMKKVSLLIVAVLLCCAGSADAAERFAAPGGSGTACTPQVPCPLKTAVGKAKEGDEVIVGAGTYFVSEPIEPENFELEEIYVHGDLAGPMPQIVGVPPAAEPFSPISISGANSVLSYLAISTSGSAEQVGLNCFGATVERVSVVVSSPASAGISMAGSCDVRDSTVWAQGAESTALSAYAIFGDPTAAVRNVTAEATGPKSFGLAISFPGGFEDGSDTVNVVNSIVAGTEFDLRAFNGGEGPGKIVVSHSNFRTKKGEGAATIADAGGNQTAAPLFVAAASGDFREAAGSPTIDAGVLDPEIGALDLAGNPRVIGPAPDIGAFEFVPPSPPAGGSGTGTPAPAPTPPRLLALSISPTSFRTSPGAKGKKKAPVGATVSYRLAAAGTVAFKVAKQLPGRKVGGKCAAPSRANRGKAKCTRSVPVKGGFTDQGAAGPNSFRFAGKVGGKALGPGRYELVGTSGGVTKEAAFSIQR